MNNKELEDLKKELSDDKGLIISPERIVGQIKTFEKGISPLKLVRACTIGDGIKLISDDEKEYFLKIFQAALDEGRIIKFVPASGAATRMFKKLLSLRARFGTFEFDKLKKLAGDGDEDCIAALEFYNNINRFAFFKELSILAESKVEKVI